jgi:hypothetical protein
MEGGYQQPSLPPPPHHPRLSSEAQQQQQNLQQPQQQQPPAYNKPHGRLDQGAAKLEKGVGRLLKRLEKKIG